MRRAQLAINSASTVRATFEECLPAYAEAGFTQVELMLSQVKNYLEAGHSVAQARALLDRHGLRCIGGFECPVSAFAPADLQAANGERILANATLLAELGAYAMVIGSDAPGADFRGDPIAHLAARVGELAERTGALGIGLNFEFNWSPLVKSVRTAAAVALQSGSAHAGVLFDPAHYHCTPSKFEQLTPQVVATIKHVHVDDMADIPGELSHCNSDRRLPGQGCLDLPALFGRLEEYGYAGAWSIEMFDEELWAMPTAQAARVMYDSLLPLCSD
jgi:4-hydroxyphenylpyruvate dioxygenase